MSLEDLAKVTEAVTAIRSTLESGRAEDAAQRTALTTKLTELEGRLAKAEETMRRESVTLPGSESLAKKYNAGKACRALLTGDWRDAALELDVHKEAFKRLPENAQQRVMTTLTPSAGGFLIPEELSTTVIPLYKDSSVCKAAGATIIKPNGWPFKVNKQTSATTAAFATESSAVTASDIALGQISFSPRKIGARTVLTMEQVQYGTPQTDSVVMKCLMEQLDLLQDQFALTGTGQNGQPIGILNTTGINTVAGAVSGKLIYGDLAIGIQYLEEDKVNTDNVACVLHPTQKGELFRNVNATAASGTMANEGAAFIMGTPFMTKPKFKELTGIDLFQTTQQTDGTGLIGVFSNLWMAEWGGVLVGKSDIASDGTYHAFTQDMVHLKVTRWVDSAVVRAVAFHAITSV